MQFSKGKCWSDCNKKTNNEIFPLQNVPGISRIIKKIIAQLFSGEDFFITSFSAKRHNVDLTNQQLNSNLFLLRSHLVPLLGQQLGQLFLAEVDLVLPEVVLLDPVPLLLAELEERILRPLGQTRVFDLGLGPVRPGLLLLGRTTHGIAGLFAFHTLLLRLRLAFKKKKKTKIVQRRLAKLNYKKSEKN